MIVLIFRNDELLFEYLMVENGFFWRVLENEDKVISRKFIPAHELKRYFPWITSSTLPDVMKAMGVSDFKNQHQFDIFLYDGEKQLTHQPIKVVGSAIVEAIKTLKSMKVIQEHIKIKGVVRIFDSLDSGFYWRWDGEFLGKVSNNQ